MMIEQVVCPQPLSEVLGARIEGLDLARPIDDAAFARVEQALHDHGFVVFPHQTLEPAQFVAFARRWGEPQPHVIDTYHHPADPNILILSNVHRAGKPIGFFPAGSEITRELGLPSHASTSSDESIPTTRRSRDTMGTRWIPSWAIRAAARVRRSTPAAGAARPPTRCSAPVGARTPSWS